MTNPFQYTSRESDTETGLYYYRARYYDPQTGRFLAEDPFRFLAGPDFYSYVRNSPLSFIDPTGLQEYPNNFVGPLPPTGYHSSDVTLTSCGRIPPHPPWVSIDNNISDARKHWNPWWFYDQVKTDGPWDFKQWNPVWDDFGNFHYGATGNAFGFPDGVLLRGAGAAQNPRGPGDPGSLRHPLGVPPFGDEPGDQVLIQRGIDYAKCKSNEKCGS
ncbi:MAG TPA: RHS repeat-associated core domain-containing protein [Candidatus Acidoferrum sp.]|nr:RHS repeat-associated core domain-containing protein [Candidatus Acidoferrum sp.]